MSLQLPPARPEGHRGERLPGVTNYNYCDDVGDGDGGDGDGDGGSQGRLL